MRITAGMLVISIVVLKCYIPACRGVNRMGRSVKLMVENGRVPQNTLISQAQPPIL